MQLSDEKKKRIVHTFVTTLDLRRKKDTNSSIRFNATPNPSHEIVHIAHKDDVKGFIDKVTTGLPDGKKIPDIKDMQFKLIELMGIGLSGYQLQYNVKDGYRHYQLKIEIFLVPNWETFNEQDYLFGNRIALTE